MTEGLHFWHDHGPMKTPGSAENLNLHLESILERELELGRKRLMISGTSSPSFLSLFLSHSNRSKINNLPHLVVTSSLADANRFQQSLQFFDSSRDAVVLSSFDVSPYSNLDPRALNTSGRLNFLYRAQNARPGDILIAPISALLQKTIPFAVLKKHSHRYEKGCDLPENLHGFLASLGYQSSPLVEDIGQYSMRGGIVDIFSPAHEAPVRLELFGETIETLRHFSTTDQRSSSEISSFHLIPCREALFDDDLLEPMLERFRNSWIDRDVEKSEAEEMLRALSRKQLTSGFDFLLPFFYPKLDSPLDHFSSSLNIWFLDPISIARESDQLLEETRTEFNSSTRHVIRPAVESFFQKLEDLQWPDDCRHFELSNIDTQEFADEASSDQQRIAYLTQNVLDLSNPLQAQTPGSDIWLGSLKNKLTAWKNDHYRIFVAVKNKSQAERLRLLLEKIDWSVQIAEGGEEKWQTWYDQQDASTNTIQVILRMLPESFRIPEDRIVFLRDEDLLGKKQRVRDYSASEDFQKQAKRLSFGDLKPGDCVVHVQHGIGVYDGLRVMNIGGIESEFIQIAYKDKDKLYLPVYRVGQLQRYSGAAQTTVLDKLGGPGWEKTKSKVKGHLRDLAADLLQLYAKRAEMHRPKFEVNDNDFTAFEAAFPFDETEDQIRAINDFMKDMTSTKPMDRLICGDVGFGKTEVAMRAAFLAAHAGKQVAVLAPTTVLTFQHFETFKKRFAGWPFEIRELNRFVSNADVKKTLNELKAGKVDIIIGTHRLLSKDVEFKDLGLMIVDEEQKFGVAHKEKIKKLRNSVDTLTLSATPIPRTLNMSLMGVRDLSIINSAPVDRLPTRTFISKFDAENLKKAIESEISRGGQVYFIHNRVQSIYGVADEIRQIVPQARIKVGHGQMDEEELEKTMVSFFNHEIDVLVCTTIVESGMDIPRANTMFIDQAHMLGLSQLYQLRGRVGRSKQRAYCYLVLPRDKKLDKDQQERLKVIQENTALGSGIRIAQYDLELRGAGNILGEDQSGHINSVGYELYMDLLNEAVHQLKGEPTEEMELDPEINLRVPAMIPEQYISDIRVRLSFYKALADIKSHEDLEKIEEELKDQFGEIPEPTLNLMGLMLIRSQCRVLGVKDISSGLKNISLKFSEKTKFKPEVAIQLAMRENKKYSITPDNRLNIRMNNLNWPGVFEELEYLIKLI
jgi:transcription-repair coupling factor (superfamily II helicase)